MKNYRWLITHDLQEVAHFLCEVQDKNKGCEGCPVESECIPGLNGWITFLRAEHGGNK